MPDASGAKPSAQPPGGVLLNELLSESGDGTAAG
jgi:hypothetical protein